MPKPLGIDLFCGLGGFTEGLLAAGYDVVGFDIERHQYGDAKYPAQLVLQDALTIHGKQFKDAALIVASPPCQEFSYMAMPWKRAKAIATEYRSSVRDVKKLTALFDACFRIQREACEAAGHHIPMVVENVRGAIPWVGRSRWNYGSFHLWGDVPALMPMTRRFAKVPMPPGCDSLTIGFQQNAKVQMADGQKVPGFRFDGSGRSFQTASVAAHQIVNDCDSEAVLATSPSGDATDCAAFAADHGRKNTGGSWFNIGSPGQKETNRNPVHELTRDGVKQGGSHHSKSNARKAASAAIAKIPFPLARYIAVTFKPMPI